jgi:hypothetical protein
MWARHSVMAVAKDDELNSLSTIASATVSFSASS